MNAVQQLIQDPVTFIHENLLTVQDGKVWYPFAGDQKLVDRNGCARLKLVDMTTRGYEIHPGPAKRSSFFAMRKVQPALAKGLYAVEMADEQDADTFNAYICPYREDRASAMVLDSHADIMVTAELNNCTFGVGSAAPGSGARMVMHANASGLATAPTRKGYAPQFKQQEADVLGGLGSNASVWRPGNYRKVDMKRDIDTRSTIIGIRGSTGNWSFYAQIFNASMIGRAMIEVKKFS